MKALARVAERFMDNKDLWMKAIDNYSAYTSGQQKLLKIFINTAVDNVVVASVSDLNEVSKISKPSIYRCLERFQTDGIIEPIKEGNIRLNSYRLKTSKIDDITERYLKKKSLMIK